MKYLVVLGLSIIIILIYRYYSKRNVKVTFDKQDQNIKIENQQTKHDFVLNYYDLNYYNQQDTLQNNILENVLVPVDFHWEINEEEIPFNLPNIPENLVRQFNNDSQNVHDTFIQEKIKETHKKLYKPCKKSNFLNEIKEEFKDVKDVIHKIQIRNSYISNIDKNELDVLESVWEEAKNNQNIKENLYLQLKDCKDPTGIVCGTGVVTRLTSALYIENPEEMPKDKGIINTELLNKFSKLYNEDQHDSDKEKIKQTILNEYSENIRPKVEKLINSWINEI